MVSALIAKIAGRFSAKQRSGLAGIGWSSLAQFVGLVVKLGSTLILTRMLAPEAYGILGTAMAVLTTLEWLSDLGIQPALVRHEKGGTREYLNTGWLLGLGRGCLLSSCAALAAWPLSQFYNQPALFGVLLVLAIRPILMAIRSPALPTLRRKLNYKYIFIDEVGQMLVGTACSIAMAFAFRSVWAIVLGTMAGAVTSAVLSYVLCPMRPSFRWSKDASNGIYGLGRQVFVNTRVMAVWLNPGSTAWFAIAKSDGYGALRHRFNLSMVLEGLVTRACDVYFSMLSREHTDQSREKWHEIVCQHAAGFAMPLVALSLAGSTVGDLDAV